MKSRAFVQGGGASDPSIWVVLVPMVIQNIQNSIGLEKWRFASYRKICIPPVYMTFLRRRTSRILRSAQSSENEILSAPDIRADNQLNLFAIK
jgi:1-acyl-sn-glycerol-3-phosphate acyltransferase